MSDTSEVASAPERPTWKEHLYSAPEINEYIYHQDSLIAEKDRQIAELDALQGKYALQYATETASRLSWQSRATQAKATIAELRAALQERDAIEGNCDLCGLEVDSWTGDPGLWPMTLPFNGGNGKRRTYHRKCVVSAIAQFKELRAALEEKESVATSAPEVAISKCEVCSKPIEKDGQFWSHVRLSDYFACQDIQRIPPSTPEPEEQPLSSIDSTKQGIFGETPYVKEKA